MHGKRNAIQRLGSRSANRSTCRRWGHRRRLLLSGWCLYLLPCLLAGLLGLNANRLPAAEEPPDLNQLFRTGQYARCLEAAAKAVTTHEYEEAPRLFKLRSELELGKYAEALATFDAALMRFNKSIELRWWGLEAVRFNDQPARVKQLEDEIGQLIRNNPWQYSNAPNRIIVGRFLLSQGLDPKRILDGAYNLVKKQQPNYVPAYLASGELALDKQDFALAAQAFEQAAKLDPQDADAHYGAAQAYAPSDAERADRSLKAALALNPNHVPCLLLLIDGLIDSESYDEAEQALLHVSAINPHHPRAAAYRAVLEHVRHQSEREAAARAAGLKFWKANPEVDHLIGKKLSQKYRFAEGAAHQRQALEFAPRYTPARIQLAQDLLRLGHEAEGWKLAAEVFAADGYNIVAHNLVTLHESVAKFRTLEQEGIVARMEVGEAEIYGRRVLDLLIRAKRDLCAKYGVELKSPIIVEIFPRQSDFAIRTFGLPGGAGFLGVCFGTVITANSPASQSGHPTCWESTLWHEFCHVVTLQKTHNRMPRWLSEGISVYEERQADIRWGQRINPQFRKMLLGDELIPVHQLSGAFLRPASPLHLQFAYFESSLVVEFLIEKYGLATLLRILDDLGNGITINESLDRHTGSLDELNSAFVAFARAQAEAMAPGADWSEPELPARADVKQLTEWLRTHPTNYAGLRRLAQRLIEDQQWPAARETLLTMVKLYPDDESDDGPYPLLARVYRELGETEQERAVLARFAELADDDVDVLSRLTELSTAAGEWQLAARYAQQWLAINPLQPAPHRVAAAAAEKLGADHQAIDSYRALLRLAPINQAELQMRLASALHRTGELGAARQHALLALEEAPRYRAAQRKLLEILAARKDPDESDAGEPLVAPPPPLPVTEVVP